MMLEDREADSAESWRVEGGHDDASSHHAADDGNSLPLPGLRHFLPAMVVPGICRGLRSVTDELGRSISPGFWRPEPGPVVYGQVIRKVDSNTRALSSSTRSLSRSTSGTDSGV